MSVVNRMLLDIDQRHGAADIKAQGPYPDIRSVPTRVAAPARTPILGVLAVAGMLALAAGVAYRAGWFDRAPLPVVKPLVIAPAPAVASVTPAPPALPVPEVAAPPAPPAATVTERGSEPAPSKPAVRASTPRPGLEPFRLTLELSNLDARLVAVPNPSPRAAPPPRQVTGDETIALARALWNGGARADALATLREALGVAEGARNVAAVAPIARELARFEVADNRPQAALDLLRRLEGTLGEDADAWALRGNAEQRLALHGDSARSYLAALRMRPAESRWMLGAAISLAAEGKVDEAQAWAERARERGAMTPAIESYLQQLGVSPRR